MYNHLISVKLCKVRKAIFYRTITVLLTLHSFIFQLIIPGLVDILQDLELIDHDESVMTSSEEKDHDHEDVSANNTDHDHDHDHHRRSVIELDESLRQKRHVDHVHEVVRLNIDRVGYVL